MWGGAQYDEDLNQNRFLQDIQQNHQELLWKCCREPGWVILVPRHDTVACEALQRANMVLDHVMVEDQDGAGGKAHTDGASGDFYVTLSRKRVQLIGRQLRLVGNPQCTADVLFAETFYMTGNGNNVGNNSKNTSYNSDNNLSNKNKNSSNNIENIPGNNSKSAGNNIDNNLSSNSKNAGNNIDNILGNIGENTSNNIENILSNNSKNAGNNIENNPDNSSKNASNNIENNLSNNSKNSGNNTENIPSNNSKNAGNNNKILCNQTKQSKYVVWCISRPLLPRIVDDWHHWHVPNSALESVHDCVDFLWIESEGHAIFERLNAPIDEFARHWPDLQLWRESVAVQRDLIASLYTKCLQVALRDDRLCQKGDASAAFLRNLKLAVETHVQHQLGCHGNQLIMSIGAILCVRDATFNKIVLNMRSDRLTSDSRHDSLSMARQSLTKINNHLTVLDKLNCLKKTFNCLTAAGSCQTALTLTCDETLQHFVNLILTSNVNNWVTNLTFLKEFRFSCQNDSDSKSEDAYVIATLEAAIEYIKNLSKSVKAPLTQPNDCQMSFSNAKIQSKAGESQNYIDNNQLTISGKLTDAASVDSTESAELCHPLCVCNKCAARIPPQLLQQPDDDLMSACQRGDAALVEKLMRSSVIAPLIDDPAPLLCAAAAGHQDVLLLLLNCYANNSKNINEARDVHGNSVLHLTALNGHDSCVKAVVYTVKDLDINARNRLGETALFIAARWGYIDIINVLLQNGADVNLTNSRGQGAKEVAPNYEILSLLCTDYDSVTRSNHYCKVSVNVPTEHAAVTDNVSYGVRPKNSSQFKKVDLLLKAIANDDVPLACFYLGFKLTESVPVNCTKCHPLCTCNSCCGNNSKSEEGAFESDSINGAINVNICNGNGLTPLHIAAKYGRKDILRLLLDAGANSNVQTYKTHFTPLIFATINGHINVVRELLNCGECEVDKCDSQGHAALYYACMKNDYKLVEVLVNNGADCAIRNAKTGRTLIQELTDKGGGSATSQKIYELILKRKRMLVSAERGKKDWLG